MRLRLVVLVVAMLLSAGSAKNAKQRYAVRNFSCGSSTMSPAQQQACYNRANTQYAVESQGELVAQQNAIEDQRAAQQQALANNAAMGQRCDAVTRNLMSCQMVTPTDAVASRDYCMYSLGPTAPPRAYGLILCYEQARDCDGLKWCLAH